MSHGSAEFRLRHLPLRELSDDELEAAFAAGFVSRRLLRAEVERRRQWRAATDVSVRRAFGRV